LFFIIISESYSENWIPVTALGRKTMDSYQYVSRSFI